MRALHLATVMLAACASAAAPTPTPAPTPVPAKATDDDHDQLIETDQCPNDAEDFDHWQDEDGCPDPDNDNDGILDRDDKCPDVWLDCCVPERCDGAAPRRDVISERAFFKYRTAALDLRKQGPLLDAVAQILGGHPTIRVEVRGHADDDLGGPGSTRIGKQRADVVVAYLVAHGVAADRLVAKSYGTTLPLDPQRTPSAHAKNRRVDFELIDQDPP